MPRTEGAQGRPPRSSNERSEQRDTPTLTQPGTTGGWSMASPLDAATTFAQMYQRVAQQLLDLSMVWASETLRFYADFQRRALDASATAFGAWAPTWRAFENGRRSSEGGSGALRGNATGNGGERR